MLLQEGGPGPFVRMQLQWHGGHGWLGEEGGSIVDFARAELQEDLR